MGSAGLGLYLDAHGAAAVSAGLLLPLFSSTGCSLWLMPINLCTPSGMPGQQWLSLQELREAEEQQAMLATKKKSVVAERRQKKEQKEEAERHIKMQRELVGGIDRCSAERSLQLSCAA